MIEYNKEATCQYHLSPYVVKCIAHGSMLLHQTLFNTEISIRLPSEEAKALIELLTNGCNEDQINEFINSNADQSELTNQLLLGGFIE